MDRSTKLSIEQYKKQRTPPSPCWIVYAKVEALLFQDPPCARLRGATGATTLVYPGSLMAQVIASGLAESSIAVKVEQKPGAVIPFVVGLEPAPD